MGILHKINAQVINLLIMQYDLGLAILNIITPALKPGQVVPKGKPGHGLSWPEYVAPKEGDSRSACPMLNAMANHGILREWGFLCNTNDSSNSAP